MFKKSLFRVLLSFVFLRAVLLGTFLTFGTNVLPPAFAAFTPNPGVGGGCSSTRWTVDAKKSLNYKGTDAIGHSAVYHWELSVLALRDISSGAFCGQVSTNACVTTPTGRNIAPGFIVLNELYINGSFVSAAYPYYVVYPGQTYCAPSGTFNASYSDYITVAAHISVASGLLNNAGWQAIEVPV